MPIQNSFIDAFQNGVVNPSNDSYISYTLPPSITLEWPIIGIFTEFVVADFMDITSDFASQTVTMPDARNVSVGSNCIFRNIGPQDITILDNLGAEIVTVPAAGVGSSNIIYLLLTDNQTQAGIWGTFSFGAVNSAPQAAALAGNGLLTVGGKLNVNLPISILDSDTYNSTVADRAKFFIYTGGQGEFNLPTANTLPNGWFLAIANRSPDGQLTVIPPPPALIDGDEDLVLAIDQDCIIVTDNTNYYTLGLGTLTFFLTNVQRNILSNEAALTLTPLQATKQIQIFSGDQNQNTLVTFPNINGTYFISNETNPSSFVINVKCNGSSITTSIPSGERFIFYSDGVDLKFAPTAITDFIFQDGSATDPSITFVSGIGDGFYLIVPNTLGATINGSQVGGWNQFGYQTVSGTATNPGYSFIGASNYGINLTGTTLGLSINGTNQLTVSATAVTAFQDLVATFGVIIRSANTLQLNNTANSFNISLGAPSLLSSSQTYTLPSIAPVSNGQILSSTTAGIMSWVDPLSPSGPINLPNGTAGAPTLTWANSATAGFYSASATQVGYSSGGILSVLFGISTIQINGTGSVGGNITLNNAANTQGVSLFSPTALASSLSYELPSPYPTVNGQPLISTTAGIMSWATSLFDTNGIKVPNGTMTNPSLSFINYPTIGWYTVDGTFLNLTINGNDALTAHDSGIILYGNTTESAELQINNANNTNSITLTVTSALGSDAIYTLPSALPATNGQPLVSTMLGVMSFATPSFGADTITIPNGSASVTLQTPAAPADNYTYVWPVDAPVGGDALRVANVAGTIITLEWAT